MFKSTARFVVITSLISFLTGCIGLAVFSSTECSADLPIVDYVYDKNSWGPMKKNKMTITTLPPKDDFMKEWGKPDDIINVSDNETILVYNTKIWCGAVPAYVIPAPLVAPVCDGFDRITFRGDIATHIHFKRSDGYGVFFPNPPPIGKRECPVTYTGENAPVPPGSGVDNMNKKVPVYSAGYDLPDNTGLIVLYRPNSMLGAAGVHIIELGKDLVVPLYNGSQYKYLSALGEQEFSAGNIIKDNIKIDVESGKKYYIRLTIDVFGVHIKQVPAEIGRKESLGLALSVPQADK